MRYFYASNVKEIFSDPDQDFHYVILDTKGKCTFYIGGGDMREKEIERDADHFSKADRFWRKRGGADVFKAIIGGGWSYTKTETGLYEGAAKERIDDIIKRHKLKKF